MPLIRLAVFIILALACAFSNADITPSKNWLITSRDKKLFVGANEDFGFPSPPLSRGIAIFGRQYGGSLTIMVVGHDDLNAKSLAQALETWRSKAGLAGTVRYSEEEQGPTAVFEHDSYRLLGSVAKTSVPVQTLVAELAKIDKNVSPLWIVPSHAERSLIGAPAKPPIRKGTRYDLRSGVPERFEVTVRVPPTAGLLVAAFGLYLPLAVLIGFGLAILYARREDIPIEKRRKRFTQLALGFTYGGIATHIPIVIFILLSDAGRRAADAWIGSTRSSDLLIILLALCFPLMLVVIPFSNRVEKKLFGPAPGDPVTQNPPGESWQFVQPKWKKWASWLVGIAGVGIWISAYMIGNKSDWSMPMRIGGMLMFFLRPGRIPKMSDMLRLGPVADPSTTALANMVAYEMREKPVPVKIFHSTSDSIAAMVSEKKEICVTRGFELDLTEDEKRFVLAHEYAHLSHRPVTNIFILATLACMIAFPILVIAKVSVAMEAVAVGFVVFCSLVFASFISIRQAHMKQELDADRQALRLGRNLDAAKSALHKLQFGSSMPYLHDSPSQWTHPTMKQRAANLEAAALEMGIASSTSGEGDQHPCPPLERKQEQRPR